MSLEHSRVLVVLWYTYKITSHRTVQTLVMSELKPRGWVTQSRPAWGNEPLRQAARLLLK